MKRLLLVLLIIVLVFSVSITGCKQAAETGKSTDQQQGIGSENSEGSGKTSDLSIDPFGKYSEPVRLTAVLAYDPALTIENVPKDTTPENNGFIKVCKEKLNVDIVFDWVVPSSQFEQKFNVSLSSNELPDIISVDMRQFEMLSENGVLGDMTEAYKYASPRFKSYVERVPKVLDMTTKQGKLYAIPRYFDARTEATLLYARKDWLDKTGQQLPKTVEELTEVCKSFINNDLNGNSKKDEIAIALDNTSILNAMQFFGAYPKKWLERDGALIPGAIQPEAKKALSYLKELYNLGAIAKDFSARDPFQDIVGSKAGMLLGSWYNHGWPLAQNKMEDEKADWICGPIPGEGGYGKTIISREPIPFQVHAINKRHKNPEALVKIINLYLELRDFAATNGSIPDNGYVWQWFPAVYQDPFEIDEIRSKSLDVLEGRVPKPEGYLTDDQFKFYKLWLDYQDYIDGKVPFRGEMYLSVSRIHPEGGAAWCFSLQEKDLVTYDEFYGLPTITMVEKGNTLDTLMQETYLKIIMGALPLDAFDDFTNNWRKLGGDTATQEINEWYKTVK